MVRDDYSLCEVHTTDKPIHRNAARRMIGLWQLSKRKVVIPFQHASMRHGVPCAPNRGGGAPGPAKPNARKISGLPRTPKTPAQRASGPHPGLVGCPAGCCRLSQHLSVALIRLVTPCVAVAARCACTATCARSILNQEVDVLASAQDVQACVQCLPAAAGPTRCRGKRCST